MTLGAVADTDEVFAILMAADRLASAAMWLVVHMTYARRVRLDGAALSENDFKTHPEGHTGGSLNMVPAYVGYLTANALTGCTRSWLMGQGHCVAAIDAVNVLVGNMSPEQQARYDVSDMGLSRVVGDFYSYAVAPDGKPASPLGSHVNVHTAGGLIEGGYLGFAEIQYVHMPLPGERLVAFLSDGAFEEQRASDWTPRWWRAEDCGLVSPIMIANGRRIDQRSTMAQIGGVAWFRQHLRLNGFDPIDLDGRDPASFCWGIIEIEDRLSACASAIARNEAAYPVPLHYGIAEVPKGYGFPGAGTNAAHGLPLSGNPATDTDARGEFNTGAQRLWVALGELTAAAHRLNNHQRQSRPRERDHTLMRRNVPLPRPPEPVWHEPKSDAVTSPMEAIDITFSQIVEANPGLRPRVGNPDEMRSNRLNRTLDLLKHRVTAPEPGVAEAVDGCVITALNEEAVVSAALANKGGINLVCTYEAFAVKMLGAVRQEVIFARLQMEAKQALGWLSVPIVLTSHTWENGKNEQSHQDPTFAEALLGEMADIARVVFPPDWNTATAAMRALFGTRGQLWAIVAPKQPVPERLTPPQAEQLVTDGAIRLRGSGSPDERTLLIAIGAYQLTEALRASDRLTDRGVANAVVYLLEPGRFREPRDEREAEFLASPDLCGHLFPGHTAARLLLTHTRPAPMLGVLRPLDTGPTLMRGLGYLNRGGTLDVSGMLFTNRCTWTHAVAAAADALQIDRSVLLDADEIAVALGRRARESPAA